MQLNERSNARKLDRREFKFLFLGLRLFTATSAATSSPTVIPPIARYRIGMGTIGDSAPDDATVTVWENVAVTPTVSVTVNVVMKLFAD